MAARSRPGRRRAPRRRPRTARSLPGPTDRAQRDRPRRIGRVRNRLVRPVGRRLDRRRTDRVRQPVHRARHRSVGSHPPQRDVAEPRPARARPVARPDRRGPGAARGRRLRLHPAQPVPDRLVGGARVAGSGRVPVTALGRQRRPHAGAQRPRTRRSPCRTGRRAAPLPAGRPGLVGVPAPQPPGRDPGRRHGPGKDRPDARAVPPRARSGPRRSVPGRRPHHGGRQLAPRDRPVRSGRGGGHHPGDRGATRHLVDRGGGRRPDRRDVLRPVPSGVRPVPQHRLGDVGPRRGAVRQEPHVEDLPVRPSPRGDHQARHHRHPDREQPDGSVVAPVDRGPRALPRPPTILRGVPQADRERSGPGPARHAATTGHAPDAPTHQGRGADRAAPQGGADRRCRAERTPHAHLPDPAPAAAQEGPRPGRRRAAPPLRDLQVAHDPAPAQPGPGAHRRRARRGRLRQAGPPARGPHPGGGRRSPCAGVQHVHRLPESGEGPPGRGRDRLRLPRWPYPEPREADRGVQRR